MFWDIFFSSAVLILIVLLIGSLINRLVSKLTESKE